MNSQSKSPPKGWQKPAKPRTKPAEVRRDELMDAAARLFVAKGVDGTTIDEIVTRASVAKGTFYHYFCSKMDVILALRERWAQDFIDRARSAVDGCPSNNWPARLRRWLEAAVNVYLDESRLHDIVFHGVQVQDRALKEKNAVLGELESLLTAGAQAGAWPLDDSQLTAIVIYRGFHGAVDKAICTGDIDRTQLVRDLSTLFLRMLGSREADLGI